MKNTFSAIIFGLTILISSISDVTSQVTTNGLVGYYSFSHSEQKGNLNNFENVGGTTTEDRFRIDNNAIQLNEDSNYVTIPNTYDFLPRTINIWFMTDDVDYTDYGGIFVNDNPNLDNGLANMTIYRLNGSNKLILTISGTKDTVDIIPNIWHNASTAVDIDGNIAYYFDGELVGSKSVTSFVSSGFGKDSIVLGSNRNTNGNYFSGVIDDLRIYDRQLSTKEIKLIYNEGICLNSVTSSDTLTIQANLTNLNPRTFLNEIKIYPNPTKDYLFINCGENYSTLFNNSIVIRDSQGKIVYRTQINKEEFQINLNNWSSKGLYIINLIDSQNNTRSSKKIILK